MAARKLETGEVAAIEWDKGPTSSLSDLRAISPRWPCLPLRRTCAHAGPAKSPIWASLTFSLSLTPRVGRITASFE